MLHRHVAVRMLTGYSLMLHKHLATRMLTGYPLMLHRYVAVRILTGYVNQLFLFAAQKSYISRKILTLQDSTEISRKQVIRL